MDELKPCPFCGHIGILTVGEFIGPNDERAGLGHKLLFSTYCEKCTSRAELYFETEDEAVEAWNRRAERTCCTTTVESVMAGAQYCDRHLCHECKYAWKTQDVVPPRYCPGCGARIVSVKKGA